MLTAVANVGFAPVFDHATGVDTLLMRPERPPLCAAPCIFPMAYICLLQATAHMTIVCLGSGPYDGAVLGSAGARHFNVGALRGGGGTPGPHITHLGAQAGMHGSLIPFDWALESVWRQGRYP